MGAKRTDADDPTPGRAIEVRGAAQNNLRDLDVVLGPGLTAVVGVSGSGKSSLAFDTVYHEARRLFLESLSLGSPLGRMRPAAVRSINGLGPAVAVAQNTLNRNPNSTVATAIGAHPFLRLLFARFSVVRCPHCGTGVQAMTDEERLREATKLQGRIEVPLVRALSGSHTRLLSLLVEHFGTGAVVVDGGTWGGKPLDARQPHDISVVTGELPSAAPVAVVRAELAKADALGCPEVVIAGRSLLRSPICPTCAAWVPRLPSSAFRQGGPLDNSSHTIGGRAIADVLAMTAGAVADFLDEAPISRSARRLLDELRRRLRPLVRLGLDHLTLDRPMPTLSRGESQRVRLAVVIAGRLEDLLHVLDEPSIGLHRRDMQSLFGALAELPGPVVMVEHDAAAVAEADDVVEIGPAGGPDGGRLVLQGTPAALWEAETSSGRYFSGRERAVSKDPRPVGADFLEVHGASARNLAGFDCRFPLGRLSAVAGPSGAGKTTLVRDVVLASAAAGKAVGCDRLEGSIGRAIAVDQSPLGNNPRSNPATYTKLFDRIRDVFAKATGQSASLFSFNRPEGACPACEGMGAVEVGLHHLTAYWTDCEVCDGLRYRPEALELRPVIGGVELSIADALALTVDEARSVFTGRQESRILRALADVGLGYLQLGQPSPALSGGEAQRVRLARQLARTRPGDLVVLDEPTTGLHPADLACLATVLDRLTAAGCTVIVVEHQPDLVEAADWVVELGPGGGPNGGRLLHCGPPPRQQPAAPVPRDRARERPRASDVIRVRGARANNLRGVNVDIPKRQVIAVTGVSGSGKSSLVRDVIGAEAHRRLLESLSMYERQGVKEGPESAAELVDGLGPTLALGLDRRWSSGYQQVVEGARATVGSASGLDHLVAVVLARAGQRRCESCGGETVRDAPMANAPWHCRDCGARACPIEPRHLAGHYLAGCPQCRGSGVVRQGDVSRLIVRPDLPLCKGAMYSPAYVPRGYLCSEGTGGNASLKAFAARYDFDPGTTPWNQMTPDAQHAFLYGDPTPIVVTTKWHGPRETHWSGVLSNLAAGDQSGLYSTSAPCASCHGKRLRPEYLSIRLQGADRGDLFSMPLAKLEPLFATRLNHREAVVEEARATAARRLRFLNQVGLGYLHLDRRADSLSAGEAQRVKLAALLGSSLLGMTVLLDEPSRGMHPAEVASLAGALRQLRDVGNTVITVEHDPVLLANADHVIELGPAAGARGGRVVYAGPREGVTGGATAEALGGQKPFSRKGPSRQPSNWMELHGATENNLRIERLRLPLGVLTGVCGVSGSGKSTLVVDTIGLALAPPKPTALLTVERFAPGAHRSLTGAPARTVTVDQSRTGISSPGIFLGLIGALRKAYAASDAGATAGLTEADFSAGCDACSGGLVVERMGFLPPATHPCDACEGTGYTAEARSIAARGMTLPQVEASSIEELAGVWGDVPAIGRTCDAALRLGLGYLVVRQPAWTLSGGEAQRLKFARELAKRATKPSLYLLDEPTVGLHVRDVGVLMQALNEVVDAGHSVVVVEHDPSVLAACDWLVELGPGAGPDGGRVIAEGTPAQVARLDTPSAPYLRRALA